MKFQYFWRLVQRMLYFFNENQHFHLQLAPEEPRAARSSQGAARSSQEQPGAAQEQPGAAQEQPRRSPEATFDVFLAGRGGPKVKKLRFGSILTTILGQQHTEICSKSVFLNKFWDIWAPLPGGYFRRNAGRKRGPTTKHSIWYPSFPCMKRPLFEKIELAL